jgi:hypothetical protein
MQRSIVRPLCVQSGSVTVWWARGEPVRSMIDPPTYRRPGGSALGPGAGSALSRLAWTM